jgi:hypothetical protein
MDLSSQLLFIIIFGVIGYLTSFLIGFNIYKIVSDVGAILFMVPIIIILINPNNTQNSLSLLNFIIANLPMIIIGDIAGTIIAAITGES